MLFYTSLIGIGLVNSLLSYLPLPHMPFRTHENVVFDTGNANPKTTRVQETYEAVGVKAEKYLYEDPYVYHPHNANKTYPRQGENVDFVVA